ncbi:hypothetical protein OBBRIDRAFT_791127 [Obba rivulosa]|uniref:Uncharacterized protein n=1 Tax=Obba rivulosa TaxID=1052685 RepID=A0A8E2AY89_9APHY|nr:hypothetical protein OBBRIDRAFT_791127 [Obba rivulosa]
MRVATSGLFAGIPACVTVDNSRAVSVVSSAFTRSHCIPQTVHVSNSVAVSTSCGPVVVYSPGGWFTSSFPLEVSFVPSSGSDVVLGNDWIAA